MGSFIVATHWAGRLAAAIMLLTRLSFAEETSAFVGAPPGHSPVSPSPLTPEQELAAFQLPPGFETELVAAEPDVPKPITVVFDDAGRMWTMTAVEYPVDANENPARAQALFAGHGRDRVLVFDKPTAPGRQQPRLFADGLAIPLGLLPWQDGCLVQHGTDILFLRDSDGDGRADAREVFLTGFGIQDSHLFPHQFTRGPNDWIYLAQGAFNYSKVKDRSGRVVPFDQTKLARVRPDGTGFEIVGWGLNNIWGLVIDRQGEMFIQEANDLGYPVVPFYIGANYPGIGMHKAKPYAPWQPPLADFSMGGTGLSGLALAEDRDGFPPPYRDVMYVANPITSRIQAIKIHREVGMTHPPPAARRGPGDPPLLEFASGYRLEKLPDFLTCSDPWFRPVAIHFGPDSCLYIVDWYNPIISHNEVPRDHPQRDKTRGRIWRVRHQSMARRTPPELTRVPDPQLVEHLGAANTWEARAAWHQIVDRRATSLTAALKQVLLDPRRPVDARLLALWSLEGLRTADLGTLTNLLEAPSRALRREAVRVLGTQPFAHREVVNALAPRTEDPDPQVRAEVIRTLASLAPPDPSAIQLLLRLAKPALDGPKVKAQQNGEWVHTGAAADRAFERYLVRAALEQHPRALAAFLDSPAAGAVPTEHLPLAWLALGDADGATRLARGLAGLNRLPQEDELVLLANHLRVPEVRNALTRLLAQPARLPELLASLLRVRDQLAAPDLAELLGPAVKTWLTREPSEADEALAVRLASAFKLAALEPEIVSFLTRPNQTEDRKLAGLRALREIGADRHLALFQQLALAGKPGNPLQREAISALAASKDERAAVLLLELWSVLPGQLRALAAGRLASSPAQARQLLHAIGSGQIALEEVGDDTLEKLRLVLGDDPALAALRQTLAAQTRPVLRLDGHNDDYLDTKIDLVGPFTVEAWIKLDPGIDHNDGILGAPGQADFNFHEARFRLWDRDHHDVIVARQAILPGEWTHVAISRSAAGDFKVYLNGELDNAAGKRSTNAYRGLALGRTLPGGGTAAVLTEFRVWNVERSAEEIRTAHRTRLQGEPRPESLVHYFCAAEDWQPLHGGARVMPSTDLPPLLSAAEARALEAKFDHFRRLARQPGDRIRGREVFKTTCLACHNVQGEGGQIGPTLNGAAANGLEALLRSVLTPNAAVESGYYLYRVELTDGELVEGFLVAQDEQSVTIRQPNAEDQRLPRAQIKRAAFTRRSVMPDGLLEALKPEEVTDLFAYLNTLR